MHPRTKGLGVDWLEEIETNNRDRVTPEPLDPDYWTQRSAADAQNGIAYLVGEVKRLIGEVERLRRELPARAGPR